MEPVFGVDERGPRPTRSPLPGRTYLIMNLTFASHSRPPSLLTNKIESWIAAPLGNTACNSHTPS